MKDYYAIITNGDKFAAVNHGHLVIGPSVSKKNKMYTKAEAKKFLKEVEVAQQLSIEAAEEYINRDKHCYERIKNMFRKELKMLNDLSFRIVHVSYKAI